MRGVNICVIAIFILLPSCLQRPGINEQLDTKAPAKAYRYVICTDMTHDDDNSLVRLLHYANEVDIEAIIVTEQGPETWKIEDWPNKMWRRALDILDKYEQVADNLRKHDPKFPTADYFRSITKRGLGSAERMSGSSDDGEEHFWDYVGEGRDSDGSRYLLEVFDKPDDRPIYVGFWGGSITFAQAMWRYQQRHSQEQVQQLMDKMVFHCISFQDITFDYFIDLDVMGGRFYGDFDAKRLIPAVSLIDTGHFWKYIGATDVATVHGNSGVLGKLYDEGGEGDTPAFLNLLSMNLGLSDVSKPSYGGWGDRFVSHVLPNVWVADDEEELMRWLPAANNSFYARCLWETRDYKEANHDPVAAVEDDQSPAFLHINATPGSDLELSARGSYDPDEDDISYRWWHYEVPGTYVETVEIARETRVDARISVPEDLGRKDLHIILEVTDHGTPPLKAYKRVIIHPSS